MRVIRGFSCFAILLFCYALQTPAASNHPKILIIYDMEGVSGVTHYEMLWFQRPDEYAKGRESLTSDVNAAIRGLVAGGGGPDLDPGWPRFGKRQRTGLAGRQNGCAREIRFSQLRFRPVQHG